MTLVANYVDIRTVAAAATASAGFAHALPGTPHMVWGVPAYAAGTLTTEFPYFAAQMDSASVTYFNRGKTAETYSVNSFYLHTEIR